MTDAPTETLIEALERAAASERARAAVKKYDRQVRANTTPEYDALAAVAACDEGLYGAYGELCDVACEAVGGDRVLTDAEHDALWAAFQSYQARLRDEALETGEK